MALLRPAIETRSPALARLGRYPVLGPLSVLLIALGPPILVLLPPSIVDLVAGHHHFLTSTLDPTPLYVAGVGLFAVPWNLWLMVRLHIRIRLILMPAWAFGLLLMAVAAAAWMLGLD